MKRSLLVLALIFGKHAGTAEAQPSPWGAGESEPSPVTRDEAARRARDEAWKAAEQHEAQQKKSVMRQPEKLTGRPSGFWTSTRPAKGGAYRWRMMAVGIVVLGITIFFVLRLVRRTSAARAQAS